MSKRTQPGRDASGDRRSGQSLVEFALVLPLLALLLFGIIQYGFIFAAYMTVRNATVVAARYAVLGITTPTIPQIQDVARQAVAATKILDANNVTAVNVDQNATVGPTNGATSVEIQYNLPLIIPFVVPGKTAGNSLTLSATTIMR